MNYGLASVEWILSLFGKSGGIAPIGEDGKIPDIYIRNSAGGGAFVGNYTTLSELQAAHPTGTAGQYALVAGKRYWWNTNYSRWNAEEITSAAYNAMTQEQKNGQSNWTIIPG